MNIFVLDLDPVKCAKYHVNSHTTKMCVEYAQLLCGVHHMTDSKFEIPYKLSHKNHPCSIWARECIDNYVWLCQLGMALCKEYTYRYEKTHKSQAVIEWCYENLPRLRKEKSITPFALAMPIECKVGDAVESYRTYYMVEKRGIATWKNREIPFWYK